MLLVVYMCMGLCVAGSVVEVVTSVVVDCVVVTALTIMVAVRPLPKDDPDQRFTTITHNCNHGQKAL